MRRREFILGAASAAALQGGAVNRDEVDRARRLIEESEPKINSSALLVRQGAASGKGREPRNGDDKVYLIASLTKPLTAAGVMLLQDRGELKAADPAVKFLPEFSQGDRRRITIEQLLTHTSGLPDQLPENVEMRRRHAPLAEFVERAMRTPLLFAPGERYSYQSMGLLLAAEIAERVTKKPFREYLAEEIFRPLGMTRTALGLGSFKIADTEPSQVEYSEPLYGGADSDARSWDWNSPYWRDLGSPWGGAHSTASDYARFLESFLAPDGSPLRAETARAMIADHNQGLGAPRGLGFALGPAALGAGCSAETFGHGGATGCLAWADPAKDLTFVLLTTLPARVSNKTALRPASDIVSRAA